jgi:cytochrome c
VGGVRWLSLRLLAMGLAAVMLPSAHAREPEVSRGESLFTARCGGCHSLDAARVGPALGQVVGRAAGKAPGFDYSKALRAATHVWSRDKLLAWLTDPEALVPGQAMDYTLDAADERQAVVEFLARASGMSPAR